MSTWKNGHHDNTSKLFNTDFREAFRRPQATNRSGTGEKGAGVAARPPLYRSPRRSGWIDRYGEGLAIFRADGLPLDQPELEPPLTGEVEHSIDSITDHGRVQFLPVGVFQRPVVHPGEGPAHLPVPSSGGTDGDRVAAVPVQGLHGEALSVGWDGAIARQPHAVLEGLGRLVAVFGLILQPPAEMDQSVGELGHAGGDRGEL